MEDIMIDSEDEKQMILLGTIYVKKQIQETPITQEDFLPPISTSTSFYFPDKQFSLMSWKSTEELSAWLKQQEEIKFGRRLFQIDPYKQLTVYYWCRLCKAKMIFKKTKAGLVISKFQNHHVHLTSRRQILSNARKLVQKKLNQTGIEQIKQMLNKQFKFNTQTAQGVIDQVIAASPLQGIQKILVHKGYELRYQGEDKAMPDVLLAISGSMKEACQIWGDQVAFNIVDDILKHKKGSKRYVAGTFTGMASDLQLVIFGSCVMVDDSKESFFTLFKNFLEVTGKQPDTFITEDRAEVNQAIKQLQEQGIFRGSHVFDTFQVLKTLQKQTTDERFPYYKKLFLTRYDYKYQSILTKITNIQKRQFGDSSVMQVPPEMSDNEQPQQQQKVKQQCTSKKDSSCRVSNVQSSRVQQVLPPQLLPYILTRSPQLCFSQMPQKFVGFSCFLNRYENFTKILRQKIQFAYTARKFFMRIDNLQGKMLNKCIRVFVSSEYYERKFNDEKLRDVRVKVGKKLLDKFICLYVEGLVNTVEGNFGFWTVRDPNYAEFKVKLDSIDKCKCECGYSEKMGLPCQHIIAVIKNTPELNYVSHLHARWISEGFFRRQPKMGPGRRSGRRLMRH